MMYSNLGLSFRETLPLRKIQASVVIHFKESFRLIPLLYPPPSRWTVPLMTDLSHRVQCLSFIFHSHTYTLYLPSIYTYTVHIYRINIKHLPTPLEMYCTQFVFILGELNTMHRPHENSHRGGYGVYGVPYRHGRLPKWAGQGSNMA